ncbi:tyrosine-protein phosphatase non-receptor type 18 [Bombina bombina]|uniref:tyrosine-protein phosphatase non-receptor type 18 n=1 Tax=Bombina bombina TaxID=8345 RepID=UPI00235AD8E0|nr:tyrosine-protein phosphatase non-receptor type 18 [Bombina bombina]
MGTMSQVTDNLRGFLSQVQTMKRRGEEDPLGKEFQEIKVRSMTIKQDNNYSTEVGRSQDNLKKNRYKDILPYDQTRVPVTFLAEEAGSDYINASFIQGLNNHQRYIATQGPLSHTVLDFWRMIWQYQVKVIVMACREVEHGKRKCERYWPLDQQGRAQYGPFTISTIEKICVNAEVVLRKLSITYQRELREVYHFQYVAWPDHGIPDSYSCFLEMIQLMRQYQEEDSTPICVHCSAGCGRTGVICTVEHIQCLLQKQRVPSDFSIFDVVLEMRRQRPAAVQTKEQYEFLYHAVTEMFQNQLQNSPNYENLTEAKAPFYDDASSVQPVLRGLRPCRKDSSSRLYSGFHQPDYLSQYSQEQSSRPLSNMTTDTYAIVQKNRPATSGIFYPSQIQPCVQESRCQSTLGHQYDNLTPRNAPAASLEQLYSTVTPKTIRVSSPASVTHSTGSISSSYSLAGNPSSSEVGSVDYTQVQIPRTVESISPSRSDMKRCQFLQSGYPASHTRTAGSVDEYEDLSNSTKGQTTGVSVCGTLGFNHRIGKPKGPRDPPTEWSR